MSTTEQEFDSVLLAVAEHCDEDVSQLMDLFFGFLARKTDFFFGQTPQQSRQCLMDAFHAQSKKLDEMMLQKRLAREEAERRQETLRKRQIEMEKAKEAELISQKVEETVVLKTVGEFEQEQEASKSEDECEEEQEGDKENSDDPSPSNSKNKKSKETAEEKQKREAEEAIERQRIMPNSGNGCDLPNYKWTQNLEQLEVSIPLRAGIPLKARDLIVEMGKTHLKVGVRGRDPIIDEDFFAEVVINEEATWMLFDRSVVNIVLPKKKKTEFWSKLVVTDPELSTKKMTSDPLYFTDLEEDHKMVVEKLMHDSHQKQMGLPTSEKQKKLDIIAKIKKINPDIDIDPSQLRTSGENNSFSF